MRIGKAAVLMGALRLCRGLAISAGLACLGPGAKAATEAPPPAAELVLDRGADGAMAASGSLPRGLEPAWLGTALAGLDMDPGLTADGMGDPRGWAGAIEALNIVLPRIGAARIRIRPGQIALTGRLKPGFSVKEVRPALRAALGPEWQLAFRLAEVPPEARLHVARDARGVRLSGILPAGLSPRQALLALGDAEDAGLATGGTGDPAAWSRALTVLETLMRAYHRAEGRLSAEGLSINGRLAPGQSADRLAAWAERRLAAHWRVDLAGRPTPSSEGDRRLDPASGTFETLTDGRWLPQFDFVPSAARCDRAAAALQTRQKLGFDTGAEKLSPDMDGALDRLAALARHCLAGGLALEIAGHTDAVGDAEANRALSLARARAVRSALAERGVPPERMHAAGFGASRPVADNETAEGRARNRRIEFHWMQLQEKELEQALDR